MAEYYLVSQLPSLDAVGEGTPLPITEQRFLELCDSFLGRRTLAGVKKITVSPPMDVGETGFHLIDRWNRWERGLRLSLAEARAKKLNRELSVPNEELPIELSRIVSAAVEIENPMEAELFLLNQRLAFLETQRPFDGFSEDYVLYYALKLKLLSRIQCFDTASGEAIYKNIYSSIVDGDSMEAEE